MDTGLWTLMNPCVPPTGTSSWTRYIITFVDGMASLLTRPCSRGALPKVPGTVCVLKLFLSLLYRLILQQRLEARLENIRDGEDGDKLCPSTPIDFYGQHFDYPNSCASSVGVVEIIVLCVC